MEASVHETQRMTGSKAQPRAGALALVVAGLVVCLALLVLHIRIYWFLTDDAFISFRYAHNLRNGAGLVFNPGFERVEGYTNFLWVLLLSGIDWLTGWPPPDVSNWISAGLALVLWGVVVAFCWQRGSSRGAAWLVLAPALWLAANRSFAVWSTGGLETKLFELLVVTAILTNIRDMETGRRDWTAPAVLLAFASWTRPDGVLIAASQFAARGLHECWRERRIPRGAVRGMLVFGAIVGAQFAFRKAYYDDWLPNTYYAKLGGESWWDMGFLYLLTFALEYVALIWLPVVLIGALGAVRGRGSAALWLIGATIVPHALYVAYCGGDHFEYRPLDLYLPLLAILLYDGLAYIAVDWHRPALAAVWGIAGCVAVVGVPLLTHLQFPTSYRPGFPGGHARDDDNADLADLRPYPWLTAIPGAGSYLGWYNHNYMTLSKHFIGLRQEEHDLFLRSVAPEGQLLGEMVSKGLLPRDTYVAIPCVGAIPYFSQLRTLDTHGLTDREIARKAMAPKEQRMMAHAKKASFAEVMARKVDIMAPSVHLILQNDDQLAEVEEWSRKIGGELPVYISAPVAPEHYLFGVMPSPPDVLRLRFPQLQLRPAWK
jgi:arabinofuranosyltransferase